MGTLDRTVREMQSLLDKEGIEIVAWEQNNKGHLCLTLDRYGVQRVATISRSPGDPRVYKNNLTVIKRLFTSDPVPRGVRSRDLYLQRLRANTGQGRRSKR